MNESVDTFLFERLCAAVDDYDRRAKTRLRDHQGFRNAETRLVNAAIALVREYHWSEHDLTRLADDGCPHA